MSKIGEKWETQWGKINSERASCMKLSFHEIIHKNIHSRWYKIEYINCSENIDQDATSEFNLPNCGENSFMAPENEVGLA